MAGPFLGPVLALASSIPSGIIQLMPWLHKKHPRPWTGRCRGPAAASSLKPNCSSDYRTRWWPLVAGFGHTVQQVASYILTVRSVSAKTLPETKGGARGW